MRLYLEGGAAVQYWVAGRNAAADIQRSSTASFRASIATERSDPGALLFDVDANLTHKDLSVDISEHLERAAAVSVSRMVVPGASIDESRAALKLATHGCAADVELFATAGVHPFYATQPVGEDDIATSMAELRALASEARCVAIGECGLDFSPGFPPRALQLPWFESQVALAAELGLPLFSHERDAHSDFRAVLRRHRVPKVLVHCFGGTQEELRAYLDMPSCFISVSGLLCKPKRGATLRAAVTELGAEALLGRIMVETDAPYLGFKGCRKGYAKNAKKQSPNVPSALPQVVAKLSECLGVSEAEVAAATTQTAVEFFDV